MSTNWTRGKGGGFVMEDGRRAVIRCPECGRENYALNVTSGTCCWCGHDENHHAEEALTKEATDAEAE